MTEDGILEIARLYREVEVRVKEGQIGELIMANEFSVVQFFENDDYEYVRKFVSAIEAVEAFKHYTTSVGARLGTTKRVIITDGGDFINMEWKYGEGIIFPPEGANGEG